MKRRYYSIILSLAFIFNIVGLCVPQIVKGADGVAYVYIISCTNTQGSSTEGGREHTFIAVKNLTSETIRVGHYNLAGNDIISIGTYGNIDDGKYAYYNIEKYRMVNNLVSYSPNVYLRAEVSASQIEALGAAINNNNKWTTFYNCTVFARNCWNSMFSTSSSYRITASLVETPVDMYNKIRAKADCRYDFEFGSNRTCSISDVYVHTATDKRNLGTVGKYQVMMM